MFGRLGRLVRSTWNSAVEAFFRRAEKPDKILPQIIRDMEADLTERKHRWATLIVAVRKTGAKIQTHERGKEKFLKIAEALISRDDAAKAEVYVERARLEAEKIRVLEITLREQEKQVETFKHLIGQLEVRLSRARNSQDKLAAQAEMAAWRKELSGLSGRGGAGDVGSCWKEFDDLVARVEDSTLEAEVLADLDGQSPTTEEVLLLEAGEGADHNDLAEQIRMLRGDDGKNLLEDRSSSVEQQPVDVSVNEILNEK